ncbi:ArsR family transcriptional regulator [Rhodonellum sp.]|uniref:ArsR family transcriptional regulator n=1 Tax=Rhodonellum sp. TaxID=2231180 RepID=UPI00271DF1EC|nr:ArsR family transcriptional regulator [Rhodonellum sp.]MDO9551426.1 ArsR family transcriptional regulator [Rhodonellum sp.]
MLDSLITSKTRLRLLIKFFINENNHSHLRGLAEEFGESTNAIRKELNNLTEAGFLIKQAEKNKIEYKVNTLHPYYSNIQDIIRKYIGLDQLVETVLERLGNVSLVVLTGDYAMGKDSGTIMIDIFGENLNIEYLKNLSLKIETIIHKKVEFSIKSGVPDPKGLILFRKPE